jgi:hypothetical protein
LISLRSTAQSLLRDNPQRSARTDRITSPHQVSSSVSRNGRPPNTAILGTADRGPGALRALQTLSPLSPSGHAHLTEAPQFPQATDRQYGPPITGSSSPTDPPHPVNFLRVELTVFLPPQTGSAAQSVPYGREYLNYKII